MSLLFLSLFWLGVNVKSTLSVVDLWLTLDCRAQGVCAEANPILRPFQDRPVVFGVVKTGLDGLNTVALARLRTTHPRATKWLLVATIGVNATLVIQDVRRLKARSP